MTEAVLTRWEISPFLASRSLSGVATFWFVVAAIGHWIFVAYRYLDRNKGHVAAQNANNRAGLTLH